MDCRHQDCTIAADAVMVTGPGQPERSVLPEHPNVLSIAEFWRRCAGPMRLTAERVAVIGGGETAASVLNELFGHRVSTVTVISPGVTLFTRGEGYFENALFSDPTGWLHHTMEERRDAEPNRPWGFLGTCAGLAAGRRPHPASAWPGRPCGRAG